jgi:hypothetical protein
VAAFFIPVCWCAVRVPACVSLCCACMSVACCALCLCACAVLAVLCLCVCVLCLPACVCACACVGVPVCVLCYVCRAAGQTGRTPAKAGQGPVQATGHAPAQARPLDASSPRLAALLSRTADEVLPRPPAIPMRPGRRPHQSYVKTSRGSPPHQCHLPRFAHRPPTAAAPLTSESSRVTGGG